MKILLLTASNVNAPIGLATVVRNLSRALRKLGNETDVISFDGAPRPLKAIIRLPYILWATTIKSLFFFPLILVKSWSKSYEVIDAQDYESLFYAWPTCKIFKIPIVLTIHGPAPSISDWSLGLSLGERIYRKIGELACHMTDGVVTLSKSEKSSLLTVNRLLKNKIVVIPNGVDILTIKKTPPETIAGNPSILYVGRLELGKGVDLLIKAFRIANDIIPESFLHIVGEGRKRKEFESLVSSLKIRNAKFHGAVSSAFAYIKGADIVVIPSRFEPFGLVALEAMAAQKPLIATRVGGLAEVIDNHRNGILASPDPEDIAEKIVILWKNAKIRDRLSENGLRTASQYTWESAAKRYLEVFKSVSAPRVP